MTATPRRTTVRFAAFGLALGVLAGCGSSPVRNPALLRNQVMRAPDTTSSSGAYKGGTDYRIGAQDLLEVSVFGLKDFDRDVRVNSNGQVSLPLIGVVQAGGVTIPELERDIADKLMQGFLQNPQVSVFVKEFTSQRMTLEGAVNKPGIYPLKGKTSLLQALALAQGVTDLADLKGVVIFRQVKGRRMGAVFDLSKVRNGLAPDPQVYGDDLIVVERSGSKSAYREFIQSTPAFSLFRWF
jgi:polysaccharide export outer membrane protein